MWSSQETSTLVPSIKVHSGIQWSIETNLVFLWPCNLGKKETANSTSVTTLIHLREYEQQVWLESPPHSHRFVHLIFQGFSLPILGWEIYGFCLLSFCQVERT